MNHLVYNIKIYCTDQEGTYGNCIGRATYKAHNIHNIA